MKVSEFDEAFSEPMSFSNGSHVISGNYTREEAAKEFSDYFGEEVEPGSLEELNIWACRKVQT